MEFSKQFVPHTPSQYFPSYVSESIWMIDSILLYTNIWLENFPSIGKWAFSNHTNMERAFKIYANYPIFSWKIYQRSSIKAIKCLNIKTKA